MAYHEEESEEADMLQRYKPDQCGTIGSSVREAVPFFPGTKALVEVVALTRAAARVQRERKAKCFAGSLTIRMLQYGD